MNEIYKDVCIKKYVIMPNHVHFIVLITDDKSGGASGAPLPTNSKIASYVGTLKRFCNKKIGNKVWQRSYYDHIIRNEDDYVMHLQYIEENPKKWLMGKDKYYV